MLVLRKKEEAEIEFYVSNTHIHTYIQTYIKTEIPQNDITSGRDVTFLAAFDVCLLQCQTINKTQVNNAPFQCNATEFIQSENLNNQRIAVQEPLVRL